MSEKSVILLEEIFLSQADTEMAVRAAVCPFQFDAPSKKLAGERGEDSPVGSPERPIEVVCETEAGTEADVQDEDVDVDGGVDDVGASGYESENSHSQIF